MTEGAEGWRGFLQEECSFSADFFVGKNRANIYDQSLFIVHVLFDVVLDWSCVK